MKSAMNMERTVRATKNMIERTTAGNDVGHGNW